MSLRAKAAALAVVTVMGGGLALTASPASAGANTGAGHSAVPSADNGAKELGPLSVQAYSCRYYSSGSRFYAGHYSGNTVVPSASRVTKAGIEAQCLLKRTGHGPGTIDGIFGSNSKAAMRRFQADMNRIYGAGLSVDGLPGPKSWPWLRSYAYWPW